MIECTRKVVGYVFLDHALPKPPWLIGPHRVIGPDYIMGRALQVWLSDHHQPTELSDYILSIDHMRLSDYITPSCYRTMLA